MATSFSLASTVSVGETKKFPLSFSSNNWLFIRSPAKHRRRRRLFKWEVCKSKVWREQSNQTLCTLTFAALCPPACTMNKLDSNNNNSTTLGGWQTIALEIRTGMEKIETFLENSRKRSGAVYLLEWPVAWISLSQYVKLDVWFRQVASFTFLVAKC